MKIGNVTLENNVFLAPMAGVTDLPFRLLCKEMGCGLVYSEMVSAKGILYNNKNTTELLQVEAAERPTAIQLFGSDPKILGEMGKKIEPYPFDIIDVNMGCPAPKIVKNGEGSAITKTPELVGQIVKSLVESQKKPVTIKFRKGFDDDHINAVEIAKIAEANGAAAVAVHGRTREQYYSGKADWDIIRQVKEAVSNLAVAGFGACMALSPSEDPNAASLPFDKRRGGFVMGEGAGTLILEEYEHAKARGAKIYAEVCGYGSTCDAHHVTAPDETAVASARAIKEAMAELEGVPAEKIYINAHGTGTALNDKTETNAIRKALGEEDAQKVHISSTKSMTGHMLGAAGAAEAIAAICAMNNSLVPPTINLQEQDEVCDLHYTPNVAEEAELEAVLSTSLGFGGHNACIAFRKFKG